MPPQLDLLTPPLWRVGRQMTGGQQVPPSKTVAAAPRLFKVGKALHSEKLLSQAFLRNLVPILLMPY